MLLLFIAVQKVIFTITIGGFTEIRKIPSMEKFRGANDKSVTQ